jgi:hypothetical protein
MSPEERRRIFDESRAVLAQADKTLAAVARRNAERIGEPDVFDEPSAPTVRYRVTDDALDHAATPQPEPQPVRDALDATTPESRLREFNCWMKPWWDAMTEVTKESIARVLDAERRQHQADLADEVRSLMIQLTSLQETVDELRYVLDAERRGNGDVIDWNQATRRASN